MKGFIFTALAATALSTASIAGPCDVAGAIPDCEAILAGNKPPAAYEDKSKLDFGPSIPATMTASPKIATDPDLPERIAMANRTAAMARANYATGIAERRRDQAINDWQKRVDDMRRITLRMPASPNTPGVSLTKRPDGSLSQFFLHFLAPD
jgi:hypothetical protein